MGEINRKPVDEISSGFFAEIEADDYRNLNGEEIEVLVKNNNYSENWNNFFVKDEFIPHLIKNSEFYGKNYIGRMTPTFLEYNDLTLPVGISDSTMVSCILGDNIVVRNVSFLSHYRIGSECILFNINEMVCSDHAKFGNGIVMEGEPEDVRIWLEIGNENGGRKILPFENLIPADAYIWSKFRDDRELMSALVRMTENGFDKRRGRYGEVGGKTVIKNSRIIKDSKIGGYAYIKGANKIKNVSILSSKEEQSQIGEGVEIVNGIIGYGSKIFYGCKAVRFVTGRNTQLKYGARLLNSVLGDNSTVSCCELLNNLIYPFHEQHHNTSFLIATTIFGQSNIAAGATIGSNHNSRAPEGEIVAGRGFWPGLCTSFKHNCKFASYSLIVKGDYQNELNIKYPFSLIYLDKDHDEVGIMPAYWFMYNMYAIARNEYKFKNRDKRKIVVQNIELDCLAPDTLGEILSAISRIEYLTGAGNTGDRNTSPEKIAEAGRRLLKNSVLDGLELKDDECMKKCGGRIIKPQKAWEFYRRMCVYSAVKNFIRFFNAGEDTGLETFVGCIKKVRCDKLYARWRNIGGQIVPEEDLDLIKSDIKNGSLTGWNHVHDRYDRLWQRYPHDKVRYLIHVCESIHEKPFTDFTGDEWKKMLADAAETFEYILAATIESRQKDFIDPFKIMNYDNKSEMDEVLGSMKNNDFISDLEKETSWFVARIRALIG
jgi:hypothetical protein